MKTINFVDDYKKRTNEDIERQNGYLNDLINKIKEETKEFNIDNTSPYYLLIELKKLIEKLEKTLTYLDKSFTALNVIKNTLVYVEADKNE